MQIQLSDTATIDAASVRRTADGYLVANARAARTGVQTYRARELGLTDRKPDDIVRVYRPPAEVFHADAMASLAYRPMTNDHPAERVTATNWKDHSIGQSGGEIARDGDFVRVPMVMMDAGAIADFEAGKRELSVGYTCDLVMDGGTVPAGERDAGQTFDAYQANIRGNHHALCWVGRGSTSADKLTFGDARTDDAPQTREIPKVSTKTITVDGFPVTVDAATEAVIVRLQQQAADAHKALSDAQTKVGELTAAVTTKDGEIAALNSQLVDARDPAKLAAAAQARAALVTAAKSLLGDAFTGDGQSDAQIRRAAVAVKLPDAADAAKMADAAVDGAFAVLTAGAKTATTDAKDPLAAAVRDAKPGDQSPQAMRDAAFAARAQGKAQAYLGPADV